MQRMPPVPDCFADVDFARRSLADAQTIPAALYTEPSVHAFDLRAVIGPHWQFVAHSSELSEVGDYVVRDIAGASALCVVADDGELRAFYNVCRHRAGPVAAGSGRCAMLRCGYHGWVYRLDGRLQHAPELGAIRGFDKRDYGLRPLDIRLTGSFVFVRAQTVATEKPQLDIDAVVDQIDKRVGEGALASQRFHRAVSYTIGCNWKVYVDNYLEGYHIPQVHPELAKILDYRAYATETFAGYSLQHSAIENATDAYSAGEALYYFVFPNLMLNILPGRLQTNVVIPLSADRCRVDFLYYYAPEVHAAQVGDDIEFGDLVQREDVDICEQVQRGLASGAYLPGRLSVAREGCVHHWHEWYKSICRQHRA